MLFVVLHNDQTSYAERVAAAELDRPPLDVKAHRARVIVELRNMREDLSVDFSTNGFCQVFRELRILYLSGKSGFDTESCSLVEL